MVFYLSCTGNTLWAARELAAATGEELVSMADETNIAALNRLDKNERVGFCFPVHGWRPPLVVRSFVKNICRKLPEGTYCYALCTAGDTVGEAVEILRNDLRQQGITIHSAFSLLMPNTYVGLPLMDVDKPEVQQRKKIKAAEDIKFCIEAVKNREKGVFSIHRGHWPRVNSRILGALFFRFLVTDKPFKIDFGQCIRCGQCAKVCPVGDLHQDKNVPPVWLHNGRCMTCFSCYHHCPRHCISFGHRTKGKGQYFWQAPKT